MKAGTLVDATIIASASEDHEEGHWVKHKGRPAVHGFKADIGVNSDTALVEEIAITPANRRRPVPMLCLTIPARCLPLLGNHFGDAVRAKGGTPRIVANAIWGRDGAETLARLEAWNP
nr:hypothetical protein [Mesorhizobium sp. L2C054A000]